MGPQGNVAVANGLSRTGNADASAAERAHPTAETAVRRTRADAVAYLTNCYPKTSHSFIRTEIAALERQGVPVLRFTVRRCREALVDPGDLAERERTSAILDDDRARLAAVVARRLLRHPLRAAATLLGALRDGWRGPGALRSLAYFLEAAALAEWLDRLGVRHVHAHFGTNPAAVARLACRMGASTYSMTVHGPDEFDAPAALGLGDKIADARFVAAVSSFGRGQLMRWSRPEHWSKLEVVRCAVAPAFLEPSVPAPPDAGPPVLVCVARLSAQKGVPLLLEAVAAVAAEERFVLRLIGDGEERAAVERLIADHGLRDHVRLLGWRSADEVRCEIAAARALVLPSFAEGLPVVLMEAMALERPVVATAIAGVPELVDAETGWLVPSGSAEALADAIRAVLRAGPDRLAAMGAAGRRRVAERHDPDRNARTLAALLRPHL